MSDVLIVIPPGSVRSTLVASFSAGVSDEGRNSLNCACIVTRVGDGYGRCVIANTVKVVLDGELSLSKGSGEGQALGEFAVQVGEELVRESFVQFGKAESFTGEEIVSHACVAFLGSQSSSRCFADAAISTYAGVKGIEGG